MTIDSLNIKGANHVLNEAQNQITQIYLDPCSLIVICSTIVLVVTIVCLFAYYMQNKKKQETIKFILKNDESVKDTIVQQLKRTDSETLRKIALEIWKQKEDSLKEEIAEAKLNDKTLSYCIEKKIRSYLRDLILVDIKEDNN